MPITFRIDPALRLLESTFAGKVSVAEMRSYMVAVFADPGFASDLRALTHLQDLQTEASSSELVQYNAWRSEQPRLGKSAIVALTPHEYGIARMFELATDGSNGAETRVFRTVEEARAWLGLTTPPVQD